MITISESIKTLLKNYHLTDEEIDELARAEFSPNKDYASKQTNSPVQILTINQKKFHIYKSGEPGHERYYLFTQLLGSGNLGTAYHCLLLNPNAEENHRYVIKTTKITHKKYFDQFLDDTWELETKALQAFHKDKAHFAKDDHFRYVVMPYAHGISLKRLQQDNPIAFLRSVKKVLKGLEKVHHHGSHGDLKQEHIIINDTSDAAEIIDFGHCGTPNAPAPQLGGAWPALTTCPINYMLIPDSQAADKIASKADDIYVLGSIFQKKMNSNYYLGKDKFLQKICGKMTANAASTRPSAEDLIAEIDAYLNVGKVLAERNLDEFAQITDTNQLDYSDYSKLYNSLNAYEQKDRYAKLESLLDQMGTAIAGGENNEKSYSSLELKKIEILKTAYKQLFEENLNTFYDPKNHSASTLEIEALYKTASNSHLLRQQRNAYWKTAETKSQIAVRNIYTHVRNKFLSAQGDLQIDAAALKSDHDAFKTQLNNERCQKAIQHYVGIQPQTIRQTRWFASTFLANAAAAAMHLYDKFNRVEGGMYLGMLPEGDLINDPHATGHIHSVISLVEWHEYLSPFPTIHPAQPAQFAEKNIMHHSMRMADYTANIDTHIAIDTLFKIAALCESAQKENKIVYFHCKAGKSRSAMMLALVMYHRHRYLENPPDHTYTIEKAYKKISARRHQVDIDKDKKTAISQIIKELDGFYANKANGAQVAPAALSPAVTSPVFVWDHIVQLPAFKTLLIKAQKCANEDAAHPHYNKIFKPFFEQVAQGEVNWYEELQKDNPENEMHQQLKQHYKNEVALLLTQVNEKISPAPVAVAVAARKLETA